MATKAAFITALGGADASLGVAGAVFTATNATNLLTDVAHGRVTGDGPFLLTPDVDPLDQLPAGLTPGVAENILTGTTIAALDTVTIDGVVYTYRTDLFTKSVGVLTGTTIVNTNTVIIGGKTYTFQDTLTNADGNVKVAVSDALSVANLIFAINLAGGVPGVDYAEATTRNPDVDAASGGGVIMDVTARDGGVAGDAITTTATLSAGDFGAATLAGGLDSADGDVLVGASDSDSLDNLIAAINLTGAGAPGILYSAQMTAHTTCKAAAGAGDTMDLRAIAPGGTVPNTLATTATLSAGDFAAATLLLGVDAVEYWIIKVSDDTFQLATSLANAIAGTAVTFSDDGVGTHSLGGSAQGLADKLEAVVQDVLIAPGNRVNIPEVNESKFWDAAIAGV